MNDLRVCPDCMAIAIQQKSEGYTWAEWRDFGFPKSGHTVCWGDCRCVIVPALYVEFSVDIEPGRAGLVLGETEMTDRQRRIIKMVDDWVEAGYGADELELVGLTEKGMELYIEKQLQKRGVRAMAAGIEEIDAVALSKKLKDAPGGLKAARTAKIPEVACEAFGSETGLGPCGAVAMAVRDLTGMPVVEVWVGDIATGYGHFANVTKAGKILDLTPLEAGVKRKYEFLEMLSKGENPELYGPSEMSIVKDAVRKVLEKLGYLPKGGG